VRVPPPKSKAFKTKVASAGGGGEGWGCRSVGTAAVGRSRVGLAAVVELKPQVVPDHAGSDIASGDGEGDGVLAGLNTRVTMAFSKLDPPLAKIAICREISQMKVRRILGEA
jgi:hypothetical protein